MEQVSLKIEKYYIFVEKLYKSYLTTVMKESGEIVSKNILNYNPLLIGVNTFNGIK